MTTTKKWRPIPFVLLLGFTLALAAVVAGGWGLYRSYAARAAGYDLREIAAIPQRSVVYNGAGEAIARIQGENRLLVPLHGVPLQFLLALMAREDSRFQEHDGIDLSGIARAFLANAREGGIRQGGSTITQQLARNSFDLRARTLDRKAIEALLARRIEQHYPKGKILEYYLNRIYFGEGCYGLQQAARFYFGKAASQLTLGESAMLVGMIRSPNRTSPFTDLAAAMEQRNLVLERMVELDMISREQAIEARHAALELVGRRDPGNQEGYVLDAVRRDLHRILTPRQQRLGGFRIYTTIDPVLQKQAEQAVERRVASIEKNRSWRHPRRSAHRPSKPGEPERTDYLQGALIAIENETGAIRALVGGRDYGESKYDRACMAKRQVGSTFKPFVYATAFERGLRPGDTVSDAALAPGEFGKHFPKKWNPKNADGSYGGDYPAASGLIRSRNTMSIRVGEKAGMQNLLQRVAHLGLVGLPPYPAIYIGGFDATLREITSAFTVFPNSGAWRPTYLVSRVEDASGRVIYRADEPARQVFPAGAAEMTSDLMEAVLQVGTGRRASSMGLRKIAGGKTGTSNDTKDAWFIGYTSSLTCGVWIGFDQPKTVMRGGYGSVLALPVWIDFIQRTPEKEYPSGQLCQRSSREEIELCRESGHRAGAGCQSAGHHYVASMPQGMAPQQRCTLHAFPVEQERGQEIEAAVAEPPQRPKRSRRAQRQWSEPPRSMTPRRAPRRGEPVEMIYQTRNGPVLIRTHRRPSGQQ